MNREDLTVFVIDDDQRVREALAKLLEPLGWRSVTFGSAGDYIAYPKPDPPACLILDVELPDINGLDFQKQMSHGDQPPIFLPTGYSDIPSSVHRTGSARRDPIGIIPTALRIDRLSPGAGCD